MKNHFFHSGKALGECISGYFKYIEGDYHTEQVTAKTKTGEETRDEKVWDREPEPPTLSGLAYYLGLNSREAFVDYELNGKYGTVLKRARLRIEAEYEKKLHYQSAAGAIFALKAMGWNERSDILPISGSSIRIEVIDAKLNPAASEKEVAL